jgi:hypothetical protein
MSSRRSASVANQEGINYITLGWTNDGVFNLFDATSAIVSFVMIINQMRKVLEIFQQFCFTNDLTVAL